MKTILKLFSVLLLSTIVNASSSWIPITMGDILSFVPSVSISPVANIYPVNATVSVNVNGTLSNNKDWIGIFKKGTQKKWGNQIAWNFVDGKSRVALTRNKLPMPGGEYEVALFFNNSSNKVEATATFNVYTKPTLTNYKASYSFGESAWVKIHNKRDTVAHPEDWIGIYPKTSNNDWGNVVEWTWVKDESPAQSGEHDWYEFDGLAVGDYEARLFFDNTYHIEAKTAFKIVEEVPNNDYGQAGPYINEIVVDNTHDDYSIYKPRNHVVGAPLVLVIGYDNTVSENTNYHRLEGVMKIIASQGCYVIGHKQIRGGDAWVNLSDTVKRRTYFIDAVNEAKNLGVDTSKLAVVGKSLGGMHTYALMKYFKGQGYGEEKSFILDLMGWYALDMTKNDLEMLNVDALILHYGGATGVQTDYPQDPRTLITISKILKNISEDVGFITLPTENHSYEGGTYEDIKNKHDLLEPIDAMFKYEFFNVNGRYNDASKILFDKYSATVQDSHDKTIAHIGAGTSHSTYGDGECLENKNGINYCMDHGLQ